MNQSRPAPDRAAYEASKVDWDAVKRFAARVARETKVPPTGPITRSRTETRLVAPAQAGFLGFGKKEAVYEKVTHTTEVLGPHWVLDERDWRLSTEDHYGRDRVDRETIEHHTIALLPDGALVKLLVVTEQEVHIGSRSSGLSRDETTQSVRDLTESDVMDLDFGKFYRQRGRPGNRAVGNRDRGDRLLRHSKGVGLSLLLRDLLNGQPPRTEEEISARSYQATD